MPRSAPGRRTAAGRYRRRALIELNKLEDTDEGCRSLFVFDNATGHELNRFQVDLILFDREASTPSR